MPTPEFAIDVGSDKLLDRPQTGAFIRKSIRQLYALEKEGLLIPSVRIGRTPYSKLSELQAWLANGGCGRRPGRPRKSLTSAR
jgi:hypothetical protein